LWPPCRDKRRARDAAPGRPPGAPLHHVVPCRGGPCGRPLSAWTRRLIQQGRPRGRYRTRNFLISSACIAAKTRAIECLRTAKQCRVQGPLQASALKVCHNFDAAPNRPFQESSYSRFKCQLTSARECSRFWREQVSGASCHALRRHIRRFVRRRRRGRSRPGFAAPSAARRRRLVVIRGAAAVIGIARRQLPAIEFSSVAVSGVDTCQKAQAKASGRSNTVQALISTQEG